VTLWTPPSPSSSPSASPWRSSPPAQGSSPSAAPLGTASSTTGWPPSSATSSAPRAWPKNGCRRSGERNELPRLAQLARALTPTLPHETGRPSTSRGSLLLALLTTLALALALPCTGCCPEPVPLTVQADPEPLPPLPVRFPARKSETWIRARADAAIDGDPLAVAELVEELKAERRDRDAHRRDGRWAPR
jgi:hypothetical protein